jgi:hypothetical protein
MTPGRWSEWLQWKCSRKKWTYDTHSYLHFNKENTQTSTPTVSDTTTGGIARIGETKTRVGWTGVDRVRRSLFRV